MPFFNVILFNVGGRCQCTDLTMCRITVLFLCAICFGNVFADTTVITYNTALYQGIDLFGDVPNPPRRDDRRDAIIRELNKEENNADIVCLQEVFIGEDAHEIIRGVKSVYPYSFSDLHDDSATIPLNGRDTTPPCGNGLLQGLYFSLFMQCAEANCGHIQTADEAISCISSNCLLRYSTLSQECLLCLTSSGPRVSEVRKKCSQPLSHRPLRYRNINQPGLLLLSKSVIHHASFVDYHPASTEYTGQYGYLQAQVDDVGQVVCTHVTVNIGSTYMEPSIFINEWITSYEEQQRAELGQLAATFDKKSPVILLGDFNVGDAVGPTTSACQRGNYVVMTSVFQTRSHDACTFCDSPENAYNGASPRRVIDHIFFKGFSYKEGSSKRVFDGTKVGGYPLSDHYGLKQTLSHN